MILIWEGRIPQNSKSELTKSGLVMIGIIFSPGTIYEIFYLT